MLSATRAAGGGRGALVPAGTGAREGLEYPVPEEEKRSRRPHTAVRAKRATAGRPSCARARALHRAQLGGCVGGGGTGFGDLGSRQDIFCVVGSRSLRHHDLLEACRAVDLPATRAGVGGDMLAADWTGKLEFAHCFSAHDSTRDRRTTMLFYCRDGVSPAARDQFLLGVILRHNSGPSVYPVIYTPRRFSH